MPISLAQFEQMAAAKPAGTPLSEILEVGDVYWSGSLVDWIYLVPDVMGKLAAIAPVRLKDRFGS
jgi:hypothetical protein